MTFHVQMIEKHKYGVHGIAARLYQTFALPVYVAV